MSKQRDKNKDLSECAYCPAPATTRDHIPPKGMFAKGMPNKPWVPSCLACNNGASLDDEYMQRLSMLWGADASKDAIEVSEKFMRSLERPNARGLQAEVRRSLSPLEDESLFPGGINFALSGDRLGRVVEKLVRGWFFKLTGKRFPEMYGFPKHMVGQEVGQLYAENAAIMESLPETVIGDNAFSYRCFDASGQDEFLTCWRFEFYGVFKIMAYSALDLGDEFRIIQLTSSPFIANPQQ
jgi:hypothetical protein